jgi:hypothetical protein
MWQPNWCQVLGGESLFKLGQHCIGLVITRLLDEQFVSIVQPFIILIL